MNDYEVSRIYPFKSEQRGTRDVLKAGMSLVDATIWAREYVRKNLPMKCDIWITRSPPGEGITKMIKVVHLGARRSVDGKEKGQSPRRHF
jgi:hypothetical protein